MKLFQVMRRSDKLLCESSFTSVTMEPKPLDREHKRGPGFVNVCKTVRLWFALDDGHESRFRVEMDRREAMQLRDNLNRWFPEGETYLEPKEPVGRPRGFFADFTLATFGGGPVKKES